MSVQEAAVSLQQKVLFYLGIDWAAETHAVCVMDANGRISAQFMNGHGQLPVAVGTSAAGGDHAVPHGEPAHRLSDLGDRPDTVVPEDPPVGHRGHITLEDVQVGAADRGGVHRHDHIGRVDDPRIRHLLPRLSARSVVDESLHQMTSLSSRADAGTGRASRGMARTHSAILAGLVGPRNPPWLSQTRHQNPTPAPPHLDGVRQPTWCGPLPRPTGRAAPRTDSLWKGSRGGVSASSGPRCTCRPRPRQGCRAPLRDGPRPPLIREPPPFPAAADGRAEPARPPPTPGCGRRAPTRAAHRR